MYSNGWSVKDGTIVEGPSKNPYKYIVQFSKEYANLFFSISFITKTTMKIITLSNRFILKLLFGIPIVFIV